MAGDVLLVTRHSTHVTTSKNLHKLVLIKHVLAKAGNGEKMFLQEYYKSHIILIYYNKKSRRMQASFVFLLTLGDKLHRL